MCPQSQIIAVDTEHLGEVAERLAAAEDALARTVVAAPSAGTVVGLRYRTPGGVVAPGAAILDIVPDGDALLIDARVPPLEIEAVHEGLPAQVHLSAYRQRTLPRIEGVVQHVSADRLVDETTGEAYILARIAVDAAALDELSAVAGETLELLPGMPAEVMILTGERTALDYMLAPLVDSFRRSFRRLTRWSQYRCWGTNKAPGSLVCRSHGKKAARLDKQLSASVRQDKPFVEHEQHTQHSSGNDGKAIRPIPLSKDVPCRMGFPSVFVCSAGHRGVHDTNVRPVRGHIHLRLRELSGGHRGDAVCDPLRHRLSAADGPSSSHLGCAPGPRASCAAATRT